MSDKAKKKYYKLGEQASIFTNTNNTVIIRGKEVVEVDADTIATDNAMQYALKNGHIREATSDEFDTYENQRAKTKVLTPAEQAKTQAQNPIDGKGKFNEAGQAVNTAGAVVDLPEGKTNDELDIMTKKELVELIANDESIPNAEKDEKNLKKMDADSLVALYKKYHKTV